MTTDLFEGLDQERGDWLRDKGIQKAVDHAEQRVPSWKEKALTLLKEYPQERFMAEEVREWAKSRGLEDPPSKRAWGGVIVKAQKTGLIFHVGYGKVKNPKAHRTPASIWRRNL